MVRRNWSAKILILINRGHLDRCGHVAAKGEKGKHTQSKEENIDSCDDMACLVEKLDEAAENHESCHT